jgi:flagellar biosynthesis/type III secretory pathway ATPase
VAARPAIEAFLRQGGEERATLAETVQAMRQMVGGWAA